MADYLLDTNILSYWYDDRPDDGGQPKKTHRSVVRAVERVQVPDHETGYVARLFVSTVTLGEVEYARRIQASTDATRQAGYHKFIREQCPESLDITPHVAEQYGAMRAWLFDNCRPKKGWPKKRRAEQLEYPATGETLGIDENDLWIAAQAMTHALVLVTHDRRGNFRRVLEQFAGSLRVEDWAV